MSWLRGTDRAGYLPSGGHTGRGTRPPPPLAPWLLVQGGPDALAGAWDPTHRHCRADRYGHEIDPQDGGLERGGQVPDMMNLPIGEGVRGILRPRLDFHGGPFPTESN